MHNVLALCSSCVFSGRMWHHHAEIRTILKEYVAFPINHVPSSTLRALQSTAHNTGWNWVRCGERRTKSSRDACGSFCCWRSKTFGQYRRPLRDCMLQHASVKPHITTNTLWTHVLGPTSQDMRQICDMHYRVKLSATRNIRMECPTKTCRNLRHAHHAQNWWDPIGMSLLVFAQCYRVEARQNSRTLIK